MDEYLKNNENIILPGTSKSTILKQHILVLDETTGEFKYIECETEDNVSTSDYSGFILDEQTGLFIPKNDDQNFVPTDLSSCWQPSTTSFSVDSNDSNRRNIELDENFGLISKKRRKKGQGKPYKWLKNIVKKARQEGKQYYSAKTEKGKIVGKQKREKRVLKPGCDSNKCKMSKYFKCNEVTESQRKEIFNSFWKNMSWKERKVMIGVLVEKRPVARRTSDCNSRRNLTLKYQLKIENVVIPVCKKMFLNTFSLGEWTVRNWILESDDSGIPLQTEKSRKKVSMINIKKKDHVKDFLTGLPKLESHYCRQKTDKQYLDFNYTTFKDVYRIYEQFVKDKNIPRNEESSYLSFLKITHSLNIGLYKPKKDQCDLCFSYKNGNIDEATYNQHVNNKNKARLEKETDKDKALKNEINAYTLDVQAVQSVPFIAASATYFKQKLAVHQFTFFNLKTSEVYCYVWHEGEGGMDSNVFASCVSHVLENYCDLTIPTVLFSDGCSAQNRNVNLSNLLQFVAIKYNTTIYQKYLTVGHTQMECDSVHSTIERKKKAKEMYVPADFVRIIAEARTFPEPYKVTYLDHSFFKNFSKINYYKSIRPGIKSGDPQVTDLKCIKYDSTGMYFKLDFDNDWTLSPQRKPKINISKIILKSLYETSIPLPIKKYKDLQSLKKIIPKDYHSFYDNLKFNSEKE